MKKGMKAEDLPGMTGSFVDVRDVATAHIECLLQEKAGGQRFLTTVGVRPLSSYCTF
jgi:nucleoside-diphosphate-sugar epimerase